jgi:chromosomal replication initiation ATPase DnaA
MRPLPVDKAIEVACDAVGIPVEQFTSRRRIEENADARSIAYKLLYELNGWGLERLGRIWGKDHSSIRWSIRRVDSNSKLGELYEECLKKTQA